MSWQATKWAMGLGLPLAAGAVLKTLAYHADKYGMDARPGMQTMCYMSGLGERAVHRNLELLEVNGLIERQTDGRGGRKLYTNYRLLMAENPAYDDKRNPVPKTLFPIAKPRISEQETPHMETRNPAYDASPVRARAPHPTGNVKEPSIEPLAVPTFYSLLKEFSTFDSDLEKCVAWITDNDVSLERAEETASSMTARLLWNEKKSRYEYQDANGKTRSYTAIWPTFRSWVKRGPLPTNGRYPGRPDRADARSDPKDFAVKWDD